MPKGRRSKRVDAAAPSTAITRRVEQTVTDFAEDLGRLLGSAQNKAAAWLDQRENVARELAHIRDTAAGLLAKLTGNTAPASKRRGRAAGSATAAAADPAAPSGSAPSPGPRKRTMSPEARARIAAAQRARWAKQKGTR